MAFGIFMRLQCMQMQTFQPLHNQDVNRTLFREVKAVRPLYEAALSEQDFKIKWACGKKAR